MSAFQSASAAAALAPLPVVAAVVLGALAAAHLARRRAPGAAAAAILAAAVLGLVAARLVHVALNAEAYAGTAASTLDVRDGGWHVPAGLVAALAALVASLSRRPGLRAPVAAGVLAGVAVWAAGAFALARVAAPSMPASLRVLELETGREGTLAEAARGRPVVVNLWATWCAPCRTEMPVLAAAQAREPRIGVLFLNQGEDAARVRAYLERERLALREVWLDPASAAGTAVGARGLPTTLFYDARGALVEAHVGVLDEASLRARLERLRGGS
ncbi:MAG TPA: TlpA disulfide reductase family protein [Burkholderiaceae bacterium]|nr:TlpA disulfide reductase family protein [Burkholderiaceae bacterium]